MEPAQQEGTLVTDTIYCSAHYFDAQDEILVYSFYAQGTRFIDVRTRPTRARSPTTVPTTAVSWAPYYYNGYVYVADHGRGVDILQLVCVIRASRGLSSQRATALRRADLERMQTDPQLSWHCPPPDPLGFAGGGRELRPAS